MRMLLQSIYCVNTAHGTEIFLSIVIHCGALDKPLSEAPGVLGKSMCCALRDLGISQYLKLST